MKSRLSCNDSKPPQSLQASACSWIRNNEHKLENRIKILIKFSFSPFYVRDSTFVPHSNSNNSKDHRPLGAFSIGLTVLMALKSCLEAHNPKRSYQFRDKLESQESDWPTGIWNTWLHRELRWEVDRCSKSPVSSFFSVFVIWLSFASQKPGWGFALTHTALQIHWTAPPWGFFWPYCFFYEPSCLRKALEDGTSGGNTGTENKGMARWTS